MERNRFNWIVIGVVSLWLGVENRLIYIPGLIIFYPVSLMALGRIASGRLSALRYGWILGLLGSSLAFYWIAFPFRYVGGFPWALTIPCVLLVGAYFGFFCGVFSLCSYITSCLSVWRAALFLGLTWYLLEWLRSCGFIAFPWLPFVMGFSPYLFMLQGAAIIGVYALSGLYVGLICLFFLGLLCLRQKRKFVFRDLLPSVTALGLFVSIGLAGFIFLKGRSAETDRGFKVGIIQGNEEQETKWLPEKKYDSIDKYIGLSEALLERCRAKDNSVNLDLLVWPETVLPFDICLKTEAAAQRKMLNFIRRYKVPLLFGAPGIEIFGNDYVVFNRAYYYEPKEPSLDLRLENDFCLLEKMRWYEKERLVPFGEYLPSFLDISIFKMLLQGIGVFIPGGVTGPIIIGRSVHGEGGRLMREETPIGLLICYEVIFPDLARKRAAAGATAFVTISNDSWFGKSSAPRQHLNLAQMRAIEFRRWVVRATTSGISAFIDPYGRVVEETETFVPAYLVGSMVPLAEKTIYFFIGPWLPYGAVIVFLVALRHSREEFRVGFKRRRGNASVR